ncbi:MAG: hypothetical protein WC654_01510 [Patescibacteria group bacterium]
MIFIPLITIPLFFFAFALLKPHRQKQTPLGLCAICVAVSGTWILLLVLSALALPIDPLMIGVLMGMSVVGVMSKLEAVYLAYRLKHLWLARLVMILGGFYTVVLLLSGQTTWALMISIATVIVLTLVSFLLQGVTHGEALAGAQTDGQSKSVIKKLDDCC